MYTPATYIAATTLAAYHILKRKPRTCPTPLSDPLLLLSSALFSTIIGPQYIETIAGIISTARENKKESFTTTFTLFIIIYATRGAAWYVPLTLTFIALRWHCHAKKHRELLPFLTLLPLNAAAAALYAVAYAISKKTRPGYTTTTAIILSAFAILTRTGKHPDMLPVFALTLAMYPNVRIKKEKTVHTRKIYL